MNTAAQLTYEHVVELCPRAPFNFDATMHKPDHFPSSDTAWEPGTRWQTMLWQGRRLGLKLENRGTTGKPNILLSIWAEERLDHPFLESLAAEITYRYNLQLDLTDFNRRFHDDPQLGPIIRKWRGMCLLSYSSLYEFLIIAIVLQNCTVRRSVNMMQALFEKYGTRLAYDDREFYCFWSPEEIDRATEPELRRLKVGYRAQSIKRVTDAFVQKQIDEIALRSQSVEEQREALLALYGIGPASVGYILSSVFHRFDEMTHISPWEQKIYSKLFYNRNPEKPISTDRLMRLFNKRFAGYRDLAVHYIWEDLFWKRKHAKIEWLEQLIRL
jgi:3-methyladenine DNA glycosylase/8-oxoguanine DNA glycosylase